MTVDGWFMMIALNAHQLVIGKKSKLADIIILCLFMLINIIVNVSMDIMMMVRIINYANLAIILGK